MLAPAPISCRSDLAGCGRETRLSTTRAFFVLLDQFQSHSFSSASVRMIASSIAARAPRAGTFLLGQLQGCNIAEAVLKWNLVVVRSCAAREPGRMARLEERVTAEGSSVVSLLAEGAAGIKLPRAFASVRRERGIRAIAVGRWLLAGQTSEMRF